ncbi:hypothetical protein LshimejAT787_1102180 [Lyophyllum shimeji]|uniref:Uncharacterized protein n=1 Tax=Lyophyllum shimeji TaxID=47721 RepID=A0A9P3UR19_LYOSH|nr:hypothetical protein LshimejAT787_1102180 [Lyophyllum shimeji]
MSTTQTTSAPPRVTILDRVASIPIIACSLEAVDSALSTNILTRAPYSTAKDLSKGLSHTAYEYSEPIQKRLAPVISSADGLANNALDAVESRYPYPFKAQPQEVLTLVQEKGKGVADYVSSTIDNTGKRIDQTIRTPAYNAAQNIDQRFSPIVDYFAVRVNGEAGPSSPDAKYQYQRALALSKTLKDNMYVYTSESFEHLRNQHALLQKASDTAQSITALASESIASGKNRVTTLSNAMISELQNVQNSAYAFTASIQDTVKNQVPAQMRQRYTELTNNLQGAATDLKNIMAEDIPLQEKANRVRQEVHDRVVPLLDHFRKTVSDLLARGKGEASKSSTQLNGVNGTRPHGANSN